MNRKIAGFTAAAFTGVLAIASVVPAQAQGFNSGYNNNGAMQVYKSPNSGYAGNGYADRDRVVRSYCDRNPGVGDCRAYYGGNWNDNDYRNFYGNHRSGLDSIASGALGFTFGAILGSALANNNNGYNGGDRLVGGPGYGGNHVAACEARYRSYDRGTDSYLGYDGLRHRCTL